MGGAVIGSRTPFRLSFVGGGSDVAAFYREQPGKVLSVAIKKYMYIFLHPYFDEKFLLKYSQTELVENVDQVLHPIIRCALRKFSFKGLDINSIADIPSGTGLGSSSAFTVGLLHALYAQAGMFVSKERLAAEACQIEIEELREPIGKQDQYASAFGGINRITFLPNESVVVEPVSLTRECYLKFKESLIMFYTGQSRNARSVLADQLSNVTQEADKRLFLKEMTELVDPFLDAVVRSDAVEYGRLLSAGWLRKMKLSNLISSDEINYWYERAMTSGAIGGKLLGAGGGGFLLFVVPPDAKASVRRALDGLREVAFDFDFAGTHIVHIGEPVCS